MTAEQKAKDLIDKFNEEIEKEANEYAYAFGNGIFNDGLYRGFIDSFNSKISERIKVEFAIEQMEWLKRVLANVQTNSVIDSKITELKNSIK